MPARLKKLHHQIDELNNYGINARNEPAAAIVFEFGVDAQSPIAKTFEYLTCCNVDLSTFTKPASFTKSFASSNAETALCGGVACKIEYCRKYQMPCHEYCEELADVKLSSPQYFGVHWVCRHWQILQYFCVAQPQRDSFSNSLQCRAPGPPSTVHRRNILHRKSPAAPCCR